MSFNLFKKQAILPPNVLLTNFCNQNCPYCFAREEMQESPVKEMSIPDFEKLVKIFRENGIKTLRLMGGEPTIHRQFKQIIKIGKEYFQEILIFSNGLIPEENKEFLKKNIAKIKFNFNLDTPAFENDINIRRKIIEVVEDFSKETEVVIGFTLSELEKDYRKLFRDFDRKLWPKIGVRFGLAKTVLGEKPFFAQTDYKKLGKKVVRLVKFFKEKKAKDVFLDCGLQKEMFVSRDLSFLAASVHFKGWGCQGKWSSFDIATDLSCFHCFPFYREERLSLDRAESLSKINNRLSKNRCCFSIK